MYQITKSENKISQINVEEMVDAVDEEERDESVQLEAMYEETSGNWQA